MPSTFIALFYDDKNDNSNFSYIDTHDIRQNLSIDTQIFWTYKLDMCHITGIGIYILLWKALILLLRLLIVHLCHISSTHSWELTLSCLDHSDITIPTIMLNVMLRDRPLYTLCTVQYSLVLSSTHLVSQQLILKGFLMESAECELEHREWRSLQQCR